MRKPGRFLMEQVNKKLSTEDKVRAFSMARDHIQKEYKVPAYRYSDSAIMIGLNQRYPGGWPAFIEERFEV